MSPPFASVRPDFFLFFFVVIGFNASNVEIHLINARPHSAVVCADASDRAIP